MVVCIGRRIKNRLAGPSRSASAGSFRLTALPERVAIDGETQPTCHVGSTMALAVEQQALAVERAANGPESGNQGPWQRSEEENWKRVPITRTIVALLTLLAASGCEPALPTADEAKGRLSEMERTRNESQQRIANLENDKKSLLEENRRLQAELAAAEGGKAIELADKQRFLDERHAMLDTLEEELTSRQTTIIEREEKLTQQENEFYRKTNDKMIDLGEARHVKTEYETMRAEKDAAVAKAEWWLKFVWGVSIALGLSVLGISILLYRSISMHASQRRELQYRQEVAQLLGTSIAHRLPPDEAATVIDAFDRLVHLEHKRDDADKTEPTKSAG